MVVHFINGNSLACLRNAGSHSAESYCNTNLLATIQGDCDPTNTIGQRIGDEINLSGECIEMMLELNELYSDVTFRILVVL